MFHSRHLFLHLIFLGNQRLLVMEFLMLWLLLAPEHQWSSGTTRSISPVERSGTFSHPGCWQSPDACSICFQSVLREQPRGYPKMFIWLPLADILQGFTCLNPNATGHHSRTFSSSPKSSFQISFCYSSLYAMCLNHMVAKICIFFGRGRKVFFFSNPYKFLIGITSVAKGTVTRKKMHKFLTCAY